MGEKIQTLRVETVFGFMFSADSHKSDNAMNVGLIDGSFVLGLVFILNSHSSSARWGCVWISVSVPKAGGVTWTAQSEDSFHKCSIYDWHVLNSLFDPRKCCRACQVTTEASPGRLFYMWRGTISCWFFLPPTFLYSGVFIFPFSGDVARQLYC